MINFTFPFGKPRVLTLPVYKIVSILGQATFFKNKTHLQMHICKTIGMTYSMSLQEGEREWEC